MLVRRISALRIWTFFAAALATLAIAGVAAASVLYTGRMSSHPGFWLLALAATGTWLAHVVATVRDQILERLDPMTHQLDDLEDAVIDYGDQRETHGHTLAATIAHPGGHVPGRRLHPVE